MNPRMWDALEYVKDTLGKPRQQGGGVYSKTTYNALAKRGLVKITPDFTRKYIYYVEITELGLQRLHVRDATED